MNILRGIVVVAIMRDRLDFDLAQNQHWYRIPVSNVKKWLKDAWIPEYLAFYQTKVFEPEAFGIYYYAKVRGIRLAQRKELFPNERSDPKADRWYYQIILSDLKRLPHPIISHRRRRIIFIRTTWTKFQLATQINDLYHDSPLEERLWQEFLRLKIQAERQEWVKINNREYALDFAIYCGAGKLDIETDGDTWHQIPERAQADYIRDNDLETAGWSLLRFNTRQIQEQMADYVLPTIAEEVNNLGGVDDGTVTPHLIQLAAPDGLRQSGLFSATNTSPVSPTNEASAIDNTTEPSRSTPLPPRQAPLFDIPHDAPPKRKKSKT